jgi:hypothetical protein
MPNYIYWIKHRESGVIMEEDEEGDDDNIIIRGFTKYGAFDDTAMGEAEEEVATEEEVAVEDEPADDLGQVIRDAQRECESEKEKIKFERMLEDHKKLLYPTCEEGQKKVGYHTGIAVMEGKKWCIRQGIWGVIDYHKEDAFEGKQIVHHYI